MPLREPSGRADAQRAWDLMGGAPRPGRRFNAWADAHPRRVAVLGVIVLLLVLATIGGYVLEQTGAMRPAPSASAGR